LQIEFSQVVQGVMDATGQELSAARLFELFEAEYGLRRIESPRHEVHQDGGADADQRVRLTAQVCLGGEPVTVRGTGNGPIDAFVAGLQAATGETVRVLDYHEHAVGEGAGAQAVAYLEMRVGQQTLFGVGRDASIV